MVIFLYLRVSITDSLREITRRAERITTPYGEVILRPEVIEVITEDKRIGYTEGLLEAFAGKEDISIGSGFVITKDGYIISDTNVIGEAKEVYIRLYKETEPRKAEVVARNDKTFLALLKLSQDSYASLKLGDSRKIEVGESVFKHSLKTGYATGTITAIHGTVKVHAITKTEVELQNIIVTTAMSSPGDSGAPLFNKDREVIGIIVAGSKETSIIVPVEQLYSVFPQLSAILKHF